MGILDKLKAQTAAKRAESEMRPAHEQISPADINLRGAGFVKRELEKSEREFDRQSAKSLKNEDMASAQAREKFAEALDDTARAIEEACRAKNIVLDPSQLSAVRGILRNQVSCLIGAAGTGKTTCTRVIIDELAKKVRTVDLRDVEWITITNPDGSSSRVRVSEYERGNDEKSEKKEAPGIAGAAFTGRAAQQMRRALPPTYSRMISTIHSLLGYAPVYEMREAYDAITRQTYEKEVRVFRPSYGKWCKLPYTVFILDEGSMIPIPLFNELVDAMGDNCRIIIIGDIHQLPPVMGKGVLGYALQKWPTFELTQIHRQAEGNAIITNAHRILRGQMVSKASNFHILDGNKGNAAEMQTYVRQVMNKLRTVKEPDGTVRYDPFRDIIITPQNVGMIGAVELNEYFMTEFNPEKIENGIVLNKRLRIHTGTGQVEFAVGDKVMINSNISGTTITNGMLGIVETLNINGKYDQKRSQVVEDDDAFSMEELDENQFSLEELAGVEVGGKKKEDENADQRQSSHVMTIRFETGDTYACSTAGDYRRVSFGYVITCHKAQGGEYPNVFIIVHSAHAKMLSQEWLYTAVTRARQNVYILCNDRGLKQAIQRQRIKGKTLAEKIRAYVIETKSDDAEFVSFDRNKYPMLQEPREVG